jgi:hypothetical protein
LKKANSNKSIKLIDLGLCATRNEFGGAAIPRAALLNGPWNQTANVLL